MWRIYLSFELIRAQQAATFNHPAFGRRGELFDAGTESWRARERAKEEGNGHKRWKEEQKGGGSTSVEERRERKKATKIDI